MSGHRLNLPVRLRVLRQGRTVAAMGAWDSPNWDIRAALADIEQLKSVLAAKILAEQQARFPQDIAAPIPQRQGQGWRARFAVRRRGLKQGERQ